MSAPPVNPMSRSPKRAWTAPLAPLLAGLNVWWSQLGRRDRRILIGAAVLAAVLLAYAWIWLPAAAGIASLEREVPRLRAQRGEVLAMAQEARRLRDEAAQSAAAVLPTGQRRAALSRSLEAAGLSGAELIEQSAQRLQLRWARVDYGVWAVWAGGAERELGGRFVQVNIVGSQASAGETAAAGNGRLAGNPADPGGPGSPATTAAPPAPAGQVSVDLVFEWRTP